MKLFLIIFKRSLIQIILIGLGCISPVLLSAQVTGKNIVPNGSFEYGDTGFESSFSSFIHATPPGSYSVTDQAANLNKDFKNPDGGDHTEGGAGLFFVVNSDGTNKSAWSCKVNVLPNSEYDFGARAQGWTGERGKAARKRWKC